MNTQNPRSAERLSNAAQYVIARAPHQATDQVFRSTGLTAQLKRHFFALLPCVTFYKKVTLIYAPLLTVSECDHIRVFPAC